jgi:hypothetical protein
MSRLNLKKILTEEIELYFSTVNITDIRAIKDCSGIIYNFIAKYDPSTTEIQKFCRLFYGDIRGTIVAKNAGIIKTKDKIHLRILYKISNYLALLITKLEK